MAGVQFDRDSAGRISRVVKYVERSIHPTRTGRRARAAQILGGYDRCTCFLKGALSGGATATVDNVLVIHGTSPLADPTDTTEELTVYNTHAWDGDDNALCRIEWNRTTEHWEFYQVTCPA